MLRYIVERISDGQFLDLELPVTVSGASRRLCGAGAFSGTVAPDVGGLRDASGELLVDPYATYLHEEADGVIRGTWLVTRSEIDGDEWSIEGQGFSAYFSGRPYEGEYRGVGVDPVEVARHVVEHAQSFSGADIGVTVRGSTGRRVGTEEEPWELLWWDTPDCLDSIEEAFEVAEVEWIEWSGWNADRTRILKEIRVLPRAGRNRDDLAFIEGDNIVETVVIEDDIKDWCNVVVAIGAGEGRDALRSTVGKPAKRRRRVIVLDAKEVTKQSVLDQLASSELEWRSRRLRVDSIRLVDHPNAAFGTFEIGDTILVDCEVSWLGRQRLWHRIVEVDLVGEEITDLVLEVA